MNILIVETSPINKNANVTVHIRNAMTLTAYLKQSHNCRLVSREEDIEDVNEQFDYIIYISATFYFQCQRYVQLMDNQKNCKIGWLTNEFELFANDFLRNRIDFIIANFEEWGVKSAHKHNKFLMTNLNALSVRMPFPPTEKKYDVCYYGTYRKYRIPYFKKYFVEDMVLSTSSKNIKKFQILGCNCWLVDGTFSWAVGEETLNLFRASLYIEDTKTHKLFNHLANRFFEGLYCNCAVFFDKSCRNSIKKDVFQIPETFIVDSYDELMDKVQNMDQQEVDNFIQVNSKIAMEAKEGMLKEIEKFLLDY